MKSQSPTPIKFEMRDLGQNDEVDSGLSDDSPIEDLGSPNHIQESISEDRSDHTSATVPLSSPVRSQPGSSSSSNHQTREGWNGFDLLNHTLGAIYPGDHSDHTYAASSLQDRSQPGPSYSYRPAGAGWNESNLLSSHSSLHSDPHSDHTYAASSLLDRSQPGPSNSYHPAGAGWNESNLLSSHSSLHSDPHSGHTYAASHPLSYDGSQPGPSRSRSDYFSLANWNVFEPVSVHSSRDSHHHSDHTYTRLPPSSQDLDQSSSSTNYLSRANLNAYDLRNNRSPQHFDQHSDHIYSRLRPSSLDTDQPGPSRSSSDYSRSNRNVNENSLRSTTSRSPELSRLRTTVFSPDIIQGDLRALRDSLDSSGIFDGANSDRNASGATVVRNVRDMEVYSRAVIRNVTDMEVYSYPVYNQAPPNSPVSREDMENEINLIPHMGRIVINQNVEFPDNIEQDLPRPTDREFQAMTQGQIRTRRIRQSRVENYEDADHGLPIDIEDPTDVDHNAEWNCAFCLDYEVNGQFALLECCRHQTCAICFAGHYRIGWNHRSSPTQQPKPIICCQCRRPVRLWSRSSHLVTHGSKEKRNLMLDEIRRRLRVMRAGMTQREHRRGAVLFGPMDENRELWATDGWFAMYFGHMEEELRIAGFEVDEEEEGSDPSNGAGGHRDQ